MRVYIDQFTIAHRGNIFIDLELTQTTIWFGFVCDARVINASIGQDEHNCLEKRFIVLSSELERKPAHQKIIIHIEALTK